MFFWKYLQNLLTSYKHLVGDLKREYSGSSESVFGHFITAALIAYSVFPVGRKFLEKVITVVRVRLLAVANNVKRFKIFFATKSRKIDLGIVRHGQHAAAAIDIVRAIAIVESASPEPPAASGDWPMRNRLFFPIVNGRYACRIAHVAVSDRSCRRLRISIGPRPFTVFFFNRVHRFRAFVACTKVSSAPRSPSSANLVSFRARTLPLASPVTSIPDRPLPSVSDSSSTTVVRRKPAPVRSHHRGVSAFVRSGVGRAKRPPVDVTVILVCYRYRHYSRVKIAVRVSRFVVKRYTHYARFAFFVITRNYFFAPNDFVCFTVPFAKHRETVFMGKNLAKNLYAKRETRTVRSDRNGIAIICVLSVPFFLSTDCPRRYYL